MAEENESFYGALTTAKIVSMVILGLVSFCLSLLPMLLVKIFKWDVNVLRNNVKTQILLSMLLCFGAGVLLCISFLHILPELREMVKEQQDKNGFPKTELPLAEIFFLSGLFLIYLIEELVHLIFKSKLHNNNYGHNHGGINNVQNNLFVVDNPVISNTNALISEDKTIKESFLETLSGMLVVLALSFHEFFEGLAVGLEVSATDVWFLLGAVAAHKFVIAFCVGAELLISGTRRILLVIYVAIFAASTTVGIGIGMALTTDLQNPATIVLKGIAGGTLVYIVFFEVLHRERISLPHAGIYQFLAVIAGLLVLLGLLSIGEHDHEQEEHEEHNTTSLPIDTTLLSLLESTVLQ